MTARSTADPAGVAAGFVLGLLVGVGVAVPAMPPGTSVELAGMSFGPFGAVLVAAAVAMLFVPFGIIGLYVLLAADE